MPPHALNLSFDLQPSLTAPPVSKEQNAMRLLKCDDMKLLHEEEKKIIIQILVGLLLVFNDYSTSCVFLIEKAMTEMGFANFPWHTDLEELPQIF